MLSPKNFFKSRKAAFYIELACSVLSVVAVIMYASVFNGSRFMSWTVFALALVSAAAFGGMCIFEVTERWAPVAMFGLDLITLLIYIHSVYMYLSEVFYGGSLGKVTSTFVLFIIITALFVLAVILSNVCIYLKPGDVSRISGKSRQDNTDNSEIAEGAESAEVSDNSEISEISEKAGEQA